MGRLAKLRRLPAAERGLLLQAFALLWTVRLGLWLLPFSVVRRFLRGRPARSRVGHASPSPPDRVAWAVLVASGYVPRATCLARALVAQALLRRRGLPAELRIGVARGGGRALDAHAWVESGGRIVLGGDELDRYTPLRPASEPGRS